MKCQMRLVANSLISNFGLYCLNILLVLLKVEYLPLSSMDKSRQVMEEFVDIWQEAISKRSLPGHFMHMEPNFVGYGLSDHYATVMAQLIATQSVQAARN